jgi:hypothetical protein
MIDNSSPTLLAPWPLPQAISAVHHELPIPVATVRAALQFIQRFCQPAALVSPLQPLIAQVDRIYDQADRLFDLRGLVAGHHGVVSPAHHQPSRQPIALLQERIGQMREAILALRQLAEEMQRCIASGIAYGERSSLFLGLSSAGAEDTTSLGRTPNPLWSFGATYLKFAEEHL